MLTTLLETAARRSDCVAVVSDTIADAVADAVTDTPTEDGQVTYGELLQTSADLARRLLAMLKTRGTRDLHGARVALLAAPSADWIAALWGIWRAGGHAVPLALAHPEPELEHVLTDSGAAAIIATPELKPRVEALSQRLQIPTLAFDDEIPNGSSDGSTELSAGVSAERFALLLYTSGTTGRPKGVPIRHRHLEAQLRSLSTAWQWSEEDHILGVLPLHHVHGIVNIVLSALWSGATCRLHRQFDAERVWQAFEAGRPTLFMAVPTIYRRLIDTWLGQPERQESRSRAARRLRLMVSGSAALPEPTRERWREITGRTLLERYGMTEIGMALSQPYDGRREPGTVGGPLPGVEVRLEVDELQVRGPGVFDGYWQRPDETADAFTDDGYFRTGDVAGLEGGVYRLLGRRSVDILKSGGEKISALEIEAVLRRHDAVADAAVVGRPDPDWGQKVVAFVELFPQEVLDADELDALCRAHLAAFKVPKRYEIVTQLPRNALGKVVKVRLG